MPVCDHAAAMRGTGPGAPRAALWPWEIDPDFHRGASPIQFPSAEDYASFMETNYGPTISARARLLAEGQWETCRSEIIDLM